MAEKNQSAGIANSLTGDTLPAIFEKLQNMKQTLSWTTILFLVLFLSIISFGTILPIEFKNIEIQRIFLFTILILLSLSFLALLHLKINTKMRNVINLKFVLTLFSVSAIFIIVSIFIFSVFGFGVWKNENILYRSKFDSKISINSQIYDIGAFGYGKRRIIKVKPIFKYFQITTNMDTIKMNKTEWIFVDEIGDLKFP